jgi:hypothetical protein
VLNCKKSTAGEDSSKPVDTDPKLPVNPLQGLTLGPNGTVLKGGKPWRGVGLNYFNCFYRTLQNNSDTSYEEGFRILSEYKIPFVRFSATGFYPANMKLSHDNYFRLLDSVVKTAEKYKVGLIPSLFWYNACIPDMMGESLDQWGNVNSKTHASMRAYTSEVVNRYLNSPAIWAWEMGNEYDSYVDLPNAATYLPSINYPATYTNMGQPAVRTPRDFPKTENVIIAFQEFAKTVRLIDPYRLIDNGCAILDARAWHFYKEKSWLNDTQEQLEYMLRLYNPDPINLISLHCYSELMGSGTTLRRDNGMERLDAVVAAAQKIGKPVYVGEFQSPADIAPDSAEYRTLFTNFLDRMDRLKVPLASAWVFDLPQQEVERNITATNKRAWQLQVLKEHNDKLELNVLNNT